MKKEERDFILNEDLKKVMLKLSLPAILAMVLFGLNAFMDTVYVGQLLNEQALSGIALAYPLTMLMLGLGSWSGTGAGNYISILLGEEDFKTISKVIPNTNLFTILCTLVFAVPFYIFAEELVYLVGGRSEVLDYGTRYLKVALLGSPLWVYALQLNFIVRSEGKMKKAAIQMIFGLVINIILTPIFIYYLKMDIEGAAWATNIGMLIYCLVGMNYFKSKNVSFESNFLKIAYDKDVFLQVIKLGFPAFIMSIMSLIQAIVVFNAFVEYGTDKDLAFFAAANRILMFLMTPLFGLMRALQPVAGVNFGANNFERVKNSYLLFSKTGVFFVFPFWALATFFPEFTMQLVLPDTLITANDILNFRILMVVTLFLPYVFMGLTYLPAIKNAKPASILGVTRQLFLYVPMMLILPKYFGIDGIYYGATIIDVLITFWAFIIIKKSFKKLQIEGKKSSIR